MATIRPNSSRETGWPPNGCVCWSPPRTAVKLTLETVTTDDVPVCASDFSLGGGDKRDVVDIAFAELPPLGKVFFVVAVLVGSLSDMETEFAATAGSESHPPTPVASKESACCNIRAAITSAL